MILIMRGNKITDKEHKETDFTKFLFNMPYTNSILEKHNICRAELLD